LDKKYKDVYQKPLTGSVEISPNRTKTGGVAATCFGIGQPLRALKWVERYMTQHEVNASSQPVVRSFLIPYESYLELLPGTVRQDQTFTGDKEGRMQNVDSQSATDQYELTEGQLVKLSENAMSGTLRSYVVTDPGAMKPSDRLEHGSVRSMRTLYDKLGVPVFADTLANKYHPWLAKEGHLALAGASPKRSDLGDFIDTMSRLRELNLAEPKDEKESLPGELGPDVDRKPPVEESKTQNPVTTQEDKVREAAKEAAAARAREAAARLKEFLVRHVGGGSRHLRAIQREMVHFKNISERDVPPGIELSQGKNMTEGDREKIQRSEIVSFFLDEIVASASTQLEILREHGGWTVALKNEEKPELDKGLEVYAYGGFDSTDLFGERRVQRHAPAQSIESLRFKLAGMYTLDKYGLVAVERRSDRVIPILKDAGLLRDGLGEGLLRSLIDSGDLANVEMSDDSLADLLISLAIYADAWMSPLDKDQDKVEFSKARRSGGAAEYLKSDLEEIARTRVSREGKQERVVRKEINAELFAIPGLERFTDKDLRISPTHAPKAKGARGYHALCATGQRSRGDFGRTGFGICETVRPS